MSASDDNQKPPSLRIRELTITNFRTFVEPTTIKFCDDDGNADAIVVFHGDNGSGKSNALAALDLFFQTASLVLREKDPKAVTTVPWDMDYSVTGRQGDRPIHLKYRDRPAKRSGMMEIEVHFEDSRLGRLVATYSPAGNEVRVGFFQMSNDKEIETGFPVPPEKRAQLLTWLESARGPRRGGIAIFDARRSQRGVQVGNDLMLMPPHLAVRLYKLQTSKSTEDRRAWREFKNLLARFKSFNGAEITVEYPEPTDSGPVATPEVVIEHPGNSVLSLDELSSGEQHVIVLCAASLLARSSILAIEEPELSLDTKNQRLLHDILRELADKGIIDQIILESHVALFDGPNVIRFARNDDGSTSVTRGPSVDTAKRHIEEQAKEKGAEHLWVTRDGYTKLPEKMVNELGAQDGGHVWFLNGPHCAN